MNLDPWEILKLLADSTRLRIMRLLDCEELSVAELQEILEMGQSRISSHLALLRSNGLVVDRKEGKRSFYSVNSPLPAEVSDLIKVACRTLEKTEEYKKDQTHLLRVIEQRRKTAEQYFNEIAGRLDKKYCPGRSWQAIGHLLFHLTPPIDIADLGAGEGMISQLLAKKAKQVYCIDNSSRMVEIGRELAKKQKVNNLKYRLGDIEDIPLPDQSVDLALLSQALHHARKPEKAIKEAFRILRPRGQILILDLKEHQFEKAHELYADIWLGFSENRLYEMLKSAGLARIEINIVSREKEAPFFETLLASGIKEPEAKK